MVFRSILLAVFFTGALSYASQNEVPKGERHMKLTSIAFEHKNPIPPKYTCKGEDVSPPLSFENVPPNAKTLVLICDDPDAPQKTWDHWILYNIPSSVQGFSEKLSSLPQGCEEGLNSWGKTGYGGPCPPSGNHRYFFKLYALDSSLDFKRPSKHDVEQLMTGHILAKAELIGTFEKKED